MSVEYCNLCKIFHPDAHTCEEEEKKREEFKRHLKRATERVSKWPKWKQNILGKIES